jgi:hypothetical protein
MFYILYWQIVGSYVVIWIKYALYFNSTFVNFMPVSREPVCSVYHQHNIDCRGYIDWLCYDGFSYKGLN